MDSREYLAMPFRTLRYAFLASVVVLGGCFGEDDTIDASSPAAFGASVGQMQAGMSQAEFASFARSLAKLAVYANEETSVEALELAEGFAGLAALAILGAGDEEHANLHRHIGELVHGKTPEGVRRLARERERSVWLRQEEATVRRIEQLEPAVAEARADVEAGRQRLALIEVREPRYYWRDGAFTPTVEFKVANKGEAAIQAIRLEGLLEVPGRAVPYAKGGMRYTFRGGLEPGEEQHLFLEPNMLSEFADRALRAVEGLMLHLSVDDAEDAGGASLGGDPSKLKGLERELEEAREGLSRIEQRLADGGGSV